VCTPLLGGLRWVARLLRVFSSKRLLVGLELPSSCKTALLALDPHLSGLRWLPEEQLHLTLSFLGDVEAPAEDRLREALRRGASAAVFFAAARRRCLQPARPAIGGLGGCGERASSPLCADSGCGPLCGSRSESQTLSFAWVTLGLLSFLLWSALKPSKPQAGGLQQPWHQTTDEPSENMDDPNLPPLRDPWDRKWQI
jgi:hypothetical protein